MELFWLLVSAFVFVSLSNALDCNTPSNGVVEQLLKDEVTSGGGSGDSATIRGGPYYTCQVQGTTNGTYQELSVIMEYTSGGNDRVGQFEIICQISPDGWGRRVESLTVLSQGPGVTYDGSIDLWTNCSSCINTAGNDNHCIGCHHSCNIGIMKCTGNSEDDCCIAFDDNGVCQSDYTFWCNGNPCNNGGTCTGTQEGYNCACVDGYTGMNCESSLPLSQICLSRCSESISFEQNLCIFYCQLKGWREIAVASGLQLPLVEEYTSEGTTSSIRWVHAVAEQEKFHNLWLNEMLRQNLPTVPATHENDDQQDDHNLAWLEQVSDHQSYFQSWRDDYKTFIEQNTEFRELLTNITAIREDTSQNELSQVYEDYNEVWADDLKNYADIIIRED